MMELKSFRAYLELEKRRSPHTVTAYHQDIEQCFSYLLDQYGIDRPEAVKPVMIRSWAVTLMEANCQSSTIRRKMSSIKAFYKFLQRRHGLEANPVIGVSLPRKKTRIPTFIPSSSMEQFFDQLPQGDSYVDVRDRLILHLLYETGLRRSELLGLDSSRIDLTQGQIRVMGKRGKERIIPIGQGLSDMLRYYMKKREDHILESSEDSFLLTTKGTPLSVRSLYGIVRTYLMSVGQLERRSPHILRHTFATHLAESGADLQSIRSLLGHRSLASTQVYTHTQIAHLKKTYLQAHPRGQKRPVGEPSFIKKNG
ncbi:MAG: tyrosine-type recombinase/integrase [Saprospiraceae bacterium]|nr:tyrosine-type recombinase/integrase [Saprospiraceae bacterium]